MMGDGVSSWPHARGPRRARLRGWVRLAALVIAVAGFVLLYETRMLDSTYAAWQAMVQQSGPPAPGEHLAFRATAYCRGAKTASGVGVRTGIAAADPRLLPVGTVLNIVTDELRYSGVYTVMDTGPKVQGRILDLYMWNCDEAVRFGRKDVEVTVLRLGWDPQASSPGLISRLFRRREAARAVPAALPPPPAATPLQVPEVPAALGATGEDIPADAGSQATAGEKTVPEAAAPAGP